MFVPDFFYDRYLLIFFPLFLLLFCKESSGQRLLRIPAIILTSVLICFITIFSILGTHDYLALNRSRWDAWNYAANKLNISPSNINGGYECNGWTGGQAGYGLKDNKLTDDREYVLSSGDRQGYSIVKQFQYQNYLPYEVRNICILHKN
jgi:hypothetical protein